jgi:uncharacterized protein YfaP (DUF2135 family)
MGPGLAIALMLWLNNIQQVLWFAVVPAALVIVLIVFGVQEPVRETATGRFRSPFIVSSYAGSAWITGGLC